MSDISELIKGNRAWAEEIKKQIQVFLKLYLKVSLQNTFG